MNEKQKALAAAGAVTIAVLIWFFWPANDLDRIRRKFDDLAEAVSKDSSHGAFSFPGKVEDIEAVLAEDIRVEMDRPIPSIHRRNQLTDLYRPVYFNVSQLTLAFHSIRIDLAPSADRAEAHCTVTLKTPDSGEGIDTREIIVNWVKVNGEWQIKEVYDLSTLP